MNTEQKEKDNKKTTDIYYWIGWALTLPIRLIIIACFILGVMIVLLVSGFICSFWPSFWTNFKKMGTDLIDNLIVGW